MSTYKRPLNDGEVCEDSRVAFNPNLGQPAVKKEVAPQLEPRVAKTDKPKAKPKVAEIDAVETDSIPDEVTDEVTE